MFLGIHKTFSSSKSPYRDLEGNIIGVIGISRDVSEQKHFEEELKISEDRFRRLFEQSPVSIQIFSPDGHCLQVNQAWKKLWNADQKLLDYVFTEYNVLLDPQLTSKGIAPYIQKGFSGEATSAPAVLYDPIEIRNSGSSRWVETVTYPIKDSKGKIHEVVIIHEDVTERIQAENTLKLLAKSTTLLATSLDYQGALDQIAQLAVKQFDGWCIIHMQNESGELVQTTFAHQEPKQLELYRELSRKLPCFNLALQGPFHVFETGRPELVPLISDDLLVASTKNKEHLTTLRELKLKSYLSVPLIARGKTMGAITVVSTKNPYNQQDLGLAEELASRAALAIQSAQHFDEAQKAIQMRDDFLLAASHELRTPLTPLSLQIQSLQKFVNQGTLASLPHETLKQMFDLSTTRLRSLTSLIDNLLEVSQISAGKLTIIREKVNLSQLLQKLVNHYSKPIANFKNNFELDIPNDIVGFWDLTRIEGVFENLILNAMKYGSGKPIQIRAKSSKEQVTVSVRDLGPGISEEDQKRIFERFERAVSVYQFGGLGLGLYITREIIHAHGGSIRVTSKLNQGSTFIVDLPLKNERTAPEIPQTLLG
jgi:signal transduction histidine kinase/PAS domain-containing protein